MAIKQIDLYLFLQGPVNLKIRAHMLIRFLCLMSNSGCMSYLWLMYILHIHIAIFSFVHPFTEQEYKKILDLLDEESISGTRSGRASL